MQIPIFIKVTRKDGTPDSHVRTDSIIRMVGGKKNTELWIMVDGQQDTIMVKETAEEIEERIYQQTFQILMRMKNREILCPLLSS